MGTKCKVRCIETGIIYNSANEAARSIGLKSHSGISGCCRKVQSIAGGYHWEYYIEPDLPGEIWLDAKCLTNDILYDFTGKFKCSSKGRIRQLSNGQILSGSFDSSDYISVDLNNITHKLHRIIATTFIPNDDPLYKIQVNHIDENKTNNCIENLEWVTPKENSNHGTRTERCTAHNNRKVKCVTTGEIFDSIKEAASNYKIYGNHIGEVCNGNRNSCGKLSDGTPLEWAYCDEE